MIQQPNIDVEALKRALKLFKLPTGVEIANFGLTHMPKPKLDPNGNPVLQRKQAQAGPMSAEDAVELRKALMQQMQVRTPQEVAQVMPRPEAQQKVERVAKGTPAQTHGGLLAGLGGAALGGGLGALTTGLSKGLESAPSGLIMAIPGALKGYRLGKKYIQGKELDDVLEEEVGEGKTAGVKFHRMDPGFAEWMKYLVEEKDLGTLTPEKVKEEIGLLAEGRQQQFGRPVPMSSVEQRAVRGMLGPEMFPEPPKPAKLLKPRPSLDGLLKKNPKTFAVLGGLAALGAIGLSAAKLQEYRQQKKQDNMR